ncbi:MAG: type II toxin-antitoxin system prevent-host-death family antitoxin [Cryobacterium sp.]|nr:type II toxin-antitoxin system prevent-host-death family antitoxin [Cryobacterium sp.]
MKRVNILEARNNLSKLVAAVGNGHEVVIANRGKPVVRLVAIVDDAPSHTAKEVAQWLAHDPAPRRAPRTAEELDQQISTEREAWD